MRTQTQIDRENVLVRKFEVNLDSPTQPALSVAERAELAELLEIAV